MKKIFYFGAIGMLLFEIARVYFIMPMPGSQEMNSIDIAYFLHSFRWILRIIFAAAIVYGAMGIIKSKIWVMAIAFVMLLISGYVTYMTNFKMSADTMFYQPSKLLMKSNSENKVDSNRLVIGIEYNGEAKAYPIQYMGYHHQVRDSIGGKPIMVTYCTVCRTGRVFEPVVNSQVEEFRLVGMDHYNAMFEDATTGSWWRQATGEAITGKLKGTNLKTFPAMQTSLGKWMELHPKTLVMQADDKFNPAYLAMEDYERGHFKGRLTRRDTNSWKPKSWIVGVEIGNETKAYDWNQLVKQKLIYDDFAGNPIVIVLAKDNKSFITLKRDNKDQKFEIVNDMLVANDKQYTFEGKSINPNVSGLNRVNSYQEYWHSWKTFHPNTKSYN